MSSDTSENVDGGIDVAERSDVDDSGVLADDSAEGGLIDEELVGQDWADDGLAEDALVDEGFTDGDLVEEDLADEDLAEDALVDEDLAEDALVDEDLADDVGEQEVDLDIGYDEFEVIEEPSSFESSITAPVRRKLRETGNRVGAFLAGRSNSGGSHVDTPDEFDDDLALADHPGQSFEDCDGEDVETAESYHSEEDFDGDVEVEVALNVDEVVDVSHLSAGTASEVVAVLQSDAELDAEVAAAIEVSSLLDAVSLLQKFDRELAEVESVLCGE